MDEALSKIVIFVHFWSFQDWPNILHLCLSVLTLSEMGGGGSKCRDFFEIWFAGPFSA